MKKIILASSSPRRKQLLQILGLPFIVVSSNIEEKLDPKLFPREQVELLSRQKAEAVGKKFDDALIIAADTMVSYKGKLFGKPEDKEDAKKMLGQLSGTQHTIVTGFTILDTKTKKCVTKSTETKIWFRRITQQEIADFIKREKPFDKAGAYAIHELAAVFVRKIEGDYMGAVGLSIFQVAKVLKEFGIEVL